MVPDSGFVIGLSQLLLIRTPASLCPHIVIDDTSLRKAETSSFHFSRTTRSLIFIKSKVVQSYKFPVWSTMCMNQIL